MAEAVHIADTIAATAPVRYSVEAVSDAARTVTGLSDSRPLDFVEREVF